MHSHVSKSDQAFSTYCAGSTGSQLKLPVVLNIYIVPPIYSISTNIAQ